MTERQDGAEIVSLEHERDVRVLERVHRSPELAIILALMKALPYDVAIETRDRLAELGSAKPGEPTIEEALVLFRKATGLSTNATAGMTCPDKETEHDHKPIAPHSLDLPPPPILGLSSNSSQKTLATAYRAVDDAYRATLGVLNMPRCQGDEAATEFIDGLHGWLGVLKDALVEATRSSKPATRLEAEERACILLSLESELEPNPSRLLEIAKELMDPEGETDV
jgi:hypothetical protein